MYYTHNLRTNLQEWRNRVYRSTYQNFDNNFNFFFAKLGDIGLLKSLLLEAGEKYHLERSKLDEFYESVFRNANIMYYENEQDAAASCFQFLVYLRTMKNHDPSVILRNLGHGKHHSEQLENFIENYIDPITHYLHDQIDDANSTLYLLEKYKSRVEWFLRGKLMEQYRNNNSEQYLEDDLRLFLFDQGIDYPFSTPRSASGRADIVGLIDKDDPLVLEIKIYDSSRGYRKNRVIDGFTQIVKYSNDYNKSVGYLIVFNIDNVEIDIQKTTTRHTSYPRSVIFNHKTYFIIVVNLNQDVTASKQGKLTIESISEGELTERVKDMAG